MEVKACLILDESERFKSYSSLKAYAYLGDIVLRVFKLSRNKKGRLTWMRIGTHRFNTISEAKESAQEWGLICLKRKRNIYFSTFYKDGDIEGSL